MTAATIAHLKKIAEGREAEIFAWDDGTILKLYRPGFSPAQAAHEAAAMAAAQAAGGPAPSSLGITEVEGRTGLIMERVEGPDMLTHFGRNPTILISAGSTLGRAHAALHTIAGPDALPTLKDRLHRHITTRPDLISLDLAARALDALSSLPDGDRLLHGDYHPGNVILTKSGACVIDWPNATRGDPAADVARTLLIFRLGELPPGAAFLVRTVQGIGRKMLVRGYRRSYANAAAPTFDPRAVGRWMLPVAIARLSDNIVEERERLLAYIDTL